MRQITIYTEERPGTVAAITASLAGSGVNIESLDAEATEFGGFELETNEEVAIGLAAANRDPAHFDDPERFDVARYASDTAATPHLSFGGGAHVCLGAHLARLESQIAIGKLVERFTDLELLEPKTTWGRSLFRVPSRLPVRFNATR